jgi:predicted metal-binding membrane protein
MGLMFVLGAMNPWWMAVIAAYFVAEKLLPAAEQWTRGVGVALILLGSVVILAAQTGMEMT